MVNPMTIPEQVTRDVFTCIVHRYYVGDKQYLLVSFDEDEDPAEVTAR